MDRLVHYTNPVHATSLLNVLNEQRLKKQLCNVILIVGDNKFWAHKSVLAACSEYFMAFFSQREAEACTMIHLNFCEPDTLEKVLTYLYTSSLLVDKQSMAAVQELGCNLGIPYLTSMISKKCHISYDLSKMGTSFSEGPDSKCKKLIAVVSQVLPEKHGTDLYHDEKPNPQDTTTHTPSTNCRSSTHPVREPFHTSEYKESNGCSRITINRLRNPEEEFLERGPDNRSSPLSSLIEGTLVHMLPVQPQLISAGSLDECHRQCSETLIDTVTDKEHLAHMFNINPSKEAKTAQINGRNGPFIKGLLQKPLSPYSPVPVFSSALELKTVESQEEPALKIMEDRQTDREPVDQNRKSKARPSLNIKSMHDVKCTKLTSHLPVVCVKTEQSGLLANPSDIIHVTVEDNFPVNFKDLQRNNSGTQSPFTYSGKRKVRLDGRVISLKKCSLSTEYSRTTINTYCSDIDGDKGSAVSGQKGNFKCSYCLKVLRSKAGLNRHINMFHNPKKAYSCEICFKQFHTNFKVWTHCQMQHGVLLKRSAPSVGCMVQDEKFQMASVEILQNMKKGTNKIKVRKDKHSGLYFQQFCNRSLRTRSKIHTCPYCQKVFRLELLFRQHLDEHPSANSDLKLLADVSVSNQKQESDSDKNKKQTLFPCSFCSENLKSLSEQEDHEREFHYVALCSYCNLKFSGFRMANEHESQCETKKLTCLECARKFKSSFSLWRHQVEVHHQNTMTVLHESSPPPQAENTEADTLASVGTSMVDIQCSDSSVPGIFGTKQSPFVGTGAPRNLEVVCVKEEPDEEAIEAEGDTDQDPEGPAIWSCEKCGYVFSAQKHLDHHKEMLCHIKTFICHLCQRGFRTNFRLWCHIQTHASTKKGLRAMTEDAFPSSPSTSPSAGTFASKSHVSNNNIIPQESEELIPVKEQYSCKLCYRTFKSAFSLWSHEQNHTNP